MQSFSLFIWWSLDQMPGLQNAAFCDGSLNPTACSGAGAAAQISHSKCSSTLSLSGGHGPVCLSQLCWELLGWVGRALVRVGIFPWWDRCLQGGGAEGWGRQENLLVLQGCNHKDMGILGRNHHTVGVRMKKGTVMPFHMVSRYALSQRFFNNINCLLVINLLTATNMSSVLLKDSPGDWSYCFCFREWSANPFSVQCWQPASSLASRITVWDWVTWEECGTPQSLDSPQLYCTGGAMERLLTLTEGAGIAVAALQALRFVCTVLGCWGPCYALCCPF